MPTTPKCRERLSRRRLPNPMRKRAHAEALPFFVLGGGRRSIGGTADQAFPGSESNCRATQGTGKPFAASFVHPAAGPLVEEAVRAQGHRGAAPYGVEEATRARGGRGLKDFAGDDEKRRSAPMRRPTPTPTSPMTRRREWSSGHNEGLPQPGIGRQPAQEMLGWQHFGKHEAKEKVFGPL